MELPGGNLGPPALNFRRGKLGGRTSGAAGHRDRALPRHIFRSSFGCRRLSIRGGVRPGFGWQIEEGAVIGAGEGGIEPGLELGMVELMIVDAREDRRADQDFPPGVVLAGTAGDEGTCPRIHALLPRFQLFKFCLQGLDAFVEFGAHRRLRTVIVHFVAHRIETRRQFRSGQSVLVDRSMPPGGDGSGVLRTSHRGDRSGDRLAPNGEGARALVLGWSEAYRVP